MPWSSGWTTARSSCASSGLCVVLQPRHAAPLNAERQRHWQQRFKQRRLPPVGEAASGAQGAAAVPLDASQHQALVDALLRNLHVSVTDLRAVRGTRRPGSAARYTIASAPLPPAAVASVAARVLRPAERVADAPLPLAA